MTKTCNRPIDAVITWVDGSDPLHQKKRLSFLSQSAVDVLPGADDTRFNAINEIDYCILSILKFAPFIRKIFIVTDQQTPKINQLVRTYFPLRLQDIRIVDHTEIFEDHIDVLPTFNSRTIESMLFKIKGLADEFVYFNDDVFLARPISPTDWFIDSSPVIRGKWVLPPYERILWDALRSSFARLKSPNKKIQLAASFQLGQWNAAKIFHFRWRYFRAGHATITMSKKNIEDFFRERPDILRSNISYRFRHANQFNAVALSNHLELSNKNKNTTSTQAIYLRPHNKNVSYVKKKFEECLKDSSKLFLCVQSLDQASSEVQEAVFSEMNTILALNE